LRIDARAMGCVEQIRLSANGEELVLRPRSVILAAGGGNEALLAQVGVTSIRMQRRPLHMVLARGPLPELFGHCVDGARTRVTITSATDRIGRRVWQIGGQVSEDGVEMAPAELVEHALRELREVLPAFDPRGVELATDRVDRAEPLTAGRKRPSDAWFRREGNVIVAWPTKLALAPRLAELVAQELGEAAGSGARLDDLSRWPRPQVARPPWDVERRWFAAC
jgi:hypothetical protein